MPQPSRLTSRSRSRSRRSTMESATLTFPPRRCLLIDTSCVSVLRELSASQVRSLLIDALWRHDAKEVGQFAQSEMMLRLTEDALPTRTSVVWCLEPCRAANTAVTELTVHDFSSDVDDDYFDSPGVSQEDYEGSSLDVHDDGFT